ncbi:hypothetical protein [Goodfellowiella coeruleoviolacea]|uniref:Uncharacterized protein n=1 Tax=Goodfellowiella coeruleoviolacea TaxID=334858 RepID=A0AAE3GG67_9PSEU|nr:hypothetical protein [Goodfellowiella coeruleoviolacea]MCP2167103.1 hypothetical protein [Goodfellowiella coeruleoviolacea]
MRTALTGIYAFGQLVAVLVVAINVHVDGMVAVALALALAGALINSWDEGRSLLPPRPLRPAQTPQERADRSQFRNADDPLFPPRSTR